MDFPEIRLMTDTIADLSSLDGVHVGHAREVLEQQLAEVQQHATAKEEELKKAKEEASITESAATSREEEHMRTMAELTDVNDSYSRCRADLDYAAVQIKGLKEDLDTAHREARDTGKHSCRNLSSCQLPSVIITGDLRSLLAVCSKLVSGVSLIFIHHQLPLSQKGLQGLQQVMTQCAHTLALLHSYH